jgi:glycerophosphoryl diester phosphodiesterase
MGFLSQWLGGIIHARIEVHGHRGSRGTHPENTLPSFKEAASARADYYELDVHLSSDDVVMVFHDPVLTQRVCTDATGQLPRLPVPLRSLPAATLQKYDCGSTPQPDFPGQNTVPGTPMPTLEELLRWNVAEAPHLAPNIEIKIGAPSPKFLPDRKLFARKVIELLQAYNLADRTLVQSFDLPVIAAIKNQAPTLNLALLFENEPDFLDLTVGMGIKRVGPHYGSLTAEKIKRCHDKGVKVIPWTVNNEVDWKQLIGFGVDGLITDYPRKLRAFLAKT